MMQLKRYHRKKYKKYIYALTIGGNKNTASINTTCIILITKVVLYNDWRIAMVEKVRKCAYSLTWRGRMQ